MIKVLSLCAALLAPESSGQDPHGRSLHLKLNADFNTSYEACITTLNHARKYIGYCPQFNAQYDDLTVLETLELFASLKGIKPSLTMPMIQK